MAAEKLKGFLRDKKAKAAARAKDWNAEREAWIRAVDRLYNTIEKDYLELGDGGHCPGRPHPDQDAA
jgi:hypothetical protein